MIAPNRIFVDDDSARIRKGPGQPAVDNVVILVTAPTQDEGQRIALLLLERRKAACVNIIPLVSSLFWWQGKLDSAQEVLLIVKTRAGLTKQVVELVKQVHSYTTPEVVAVPILSGNEDYLRWIEEETENG